VDRVVIVGGGFAGLAAGRRRAGEPVEVEVVDQHNFHAFQPLLYQVATAGLDPADVAYPIRTVLRQSLSVRFVHSRASGFDLSARSVFLEDGRRPSYDHLIVASGATAATFGVPGVADHALFLYTLDDARWVRNQVLAALERTDATCPGEDAATVIVVVGGGPTGVETAGAMSELIAIRHDRLRLDPDRTRVVLLDAKERVLPGFSPASSAYAERVLRARGVEVRLGLGVEAVSAAGVTLFGGELVTASVVIWAAGVTVDGTVATGLTEHRGPGGGWWSSPTSRCWAIPRCSSWAMPPRSPVLKELHRIRNTSNRVTPAGSSPSLPRWPCSRETTPPARSSPGSKAVRRRRSPTATRG
jgi:NADH dehydrogenase